MRLLKGLSVLLIISATFAQDTSEQEDSQGAKDLQDFNQEWRVLDYAAPPPETSGWIPTDSEEQPLKRRRIRKRKRRPPVLSEEVDEPVVPRRRRPQRLDQIKEPWEEMGEEITQKSNNRRRLTPIYEETEEVTEPKVPTFERVRDPFTALQEAEEKQKKKVDESTTKISDLKTLLKLSGGLSLSEVLQERNLTLSELLKGNRQAISALVREAETTTLPPPTTTSAPITSTTNEPITSTENVKYRRLPPSIALKKDANRNFLRDYNDRLSSHEVLEAQRKRLTLLHSHKETKMFPDVTKVDVVTEETTERRVFVPSSPKISASVDYKDVDVITTVVPTITTITTQATMPKRVRKLPMTSAKLNKLMSNNEGSAESVSKVPDKAVPINFNEIFGFGNFGKQYESSESEGPFKMIIDLAELATTEDPQEVENTIQTRTPLKVLEELAMSTTVSVAEKLKHVTAKEEIMEILKSPRDRDNLARILRTRNMTVEELVAQRERGSSQRHLADIFHNKTREPEPIDAPLVGHIKITSLDTSLNRKAKTMPMASEVLVTTQPSTIKTEEKTITTTKLPYTITSFPTYKIESNKDSKVQPFLPIWHQLYPNFFQGVHENNHIQDNPGFVQPSTTTTEKINYEDLERLEEIENALAEAANGRLKVDLPQNVYAETEDDDVDEEEFISLPSGVKSAILASLAIIGLSLLVFLTILIIFKWSQKKKRLTYSGSFSGSKIRSPILEPYQRRTLRNFVSETLGKKKNYYKAHIQSMSDSIWDKDDRKTYMA